MRAEDIPAWVPLPARHVAAVLPIGHPMVERFLSDPAMEGVWSYLQSRRVLPNFLDRLLHVLTPIYDESPDNTYNTEIHQPSSCLLYTAIVAANNSHVVVYKKIIDAVIRELKETMNMVSKLDHFEPAPQIAIPEDVKSAIATIHAYCQDRINFINPEEKPGVLSATGRPPSTDPIRACVREIGTAIYAIYGDCFYGQLATIANVMFRPERPVTSTSTENWCTKPPLPIREKHK